ncbi:hypothetical protein Tco_0786579 [Tanacetum coccineum]
MSEFRDSSYHKNARQRMMTLEEEESYPWEQLKSSYVDVCRAFLKLCIVEDPIWEKIYCELEEPIQIHTFINNDLKVLTVVIEDIARGEKESKAKEKFMIRKKQAIFEAKSNSIHGVDKLCSMYVSWKNTRGFEA